MKSALCVLVCSLALAAAWGKTGHEIVATIATSLIDSNVASSVSSILGGQTLTDVCDWADEVKREPQWKWSAVLHYINTPDWACDFSFSRDCADSMCVAGAIANYTNQLANDSGDTQTTALKFLTHFVGDIHQPLHVGFTSDEGGNTIEGTYFGDHVSLHAIWDNNIIDHRLIDQFNNDQSQYTAYLLNQIKGPWAGNATAWQECSQDECANTWANGSAGLACTYAYTDENGNQIADNFDMNQNYQNFAGPIVDEQLAKAGVRLAMLLEKVLGSSSEVSAMELRSNRVVA